MSGKCNLLLSILYYLLPLFSMEDSTTTWQNPLYPLMSRYCLPDSYPLLAFNPETSSRVTLASLGTVFQTDYLQVTRPPSNKTIKQPDNETTKQQDNHTTKQQNHKTTRQRNNKATRQSYNKTTKSQNNKTTKPLNNRSSVSCYGSELDTELLLLCIF